MFDTVRLLATLGDPPLPSEVEFQTKSLFQGMEQFTINEQGRLIHHIWHFEPVFISETPVPTLLDRYWRVTDADIDLEFHGDIWLYPVGNAVPVRDYIARFTHGTLEWLVPLDALSEHQQAVIRNRV